MKFFDAHNHLQDDRFAGRQSELVAQAEGADVAAMVVNGACESDWPHVVELATRHASVIPSLGFHPWYLHERTPGWLERLEALLAQSGAAVGEIGIDRWILGQPAAVRSHYNPALASATPTSIEEQCEVFVVQLALAYKYNRPASIHCLQAWGRMEELLRQNARPKCGVVLHSYGGPAEMIPSFTKLGAYFSFPGYFLQERKQRQRDVFKRVPLDRLLVETDAPDQLPPDRWNRFPLDNPSNGKPLNHPANLPAIYEGLAEVLGVPLNELAAQVEGNFRRVFRRE
ncbi:MAG TPA: TatD family hydrolase [Candidatus Limnocylindria bacterium]|jgi:TatD DNase family protein|nr:TatD family hydrolase [Candidatus Limnocylindria bacterium]